MWVEDKQGRRLEDKGGRREDETVRIKEEGREKESKGASEGVKKRGMRGNGELG